MSADPEEMGLDPARLEQAKDFALTGGGSGIIVKDGRVVLAWGSQTRRYDVKSITKSAAGATTLGLALADGKIRLNDPAAKFHPDFGMPPSQNRLTGWLEDITLLHLATHSSGFARDGGYEPLLFEPGTKWYYSDGGPNWLAECLTLVYEMDLSTLLFERVFGYLGITGTDVRWRSNFYRTRRIDGVTRRELGSGMWANVDAMARIGYLYLRRGRWKDRQILSRDFVENVGRPVTSVSGVPAHDRLQMGEHSVLEENPSGRYGLLWWNNADGTLEDVPRDAFWAWGGGDSILLVIPSLDLVAARAGDPWKRAVGMTHYELLAGFLTPIATSVRAEPSGS